MAGLADLATASQLAAAIDLVRFDFQITAFEFKPSLGIVAKRLQQFGDEFADMRVPLTMSVENVMTVSILENFMSGGRPAWDSLAPSTVAKRQKLNAGSMILVRSGSLADVASSVGIWSIGRTSATIRDLPGNVWYGRVHQGGLTGNQFAGGNWFQKYQTAARKALGSEVEDDEVNGLAFKMFDKRLLSHGPAPKGSAPIPARPFAVFQDEDIDAIQLIFIEWIEAKIREAGLR
jgi:phage gpG-like protein